MGPSRLPRPPWDGSKAAIIVYNHPCGDPAPSAEDQEITRRLKQAGEFLGIQLLDHVVLGARGNCVRSK